MDKYPTPSAKRRKVLKMHRYKLMQDGICVATAESEDKESARREIIHYAAMYGQDGAVQIKPPL